MTSMSKRGRVELIVLLAIAIVGVAGVVYLVNGIPSAGLATYGGSPGTVFLSRDIYVPVQVNPPGNQRVDLPYSQRMSTHQYIYAPSYNNPGELRMSMFDCQSFCFGRPGNQPRHLYPKKEYGGKKLRGCVAECLEQRLGTADYLADEQH